MRKKARKNDDLIFRVSRNEAFEVVDTFNLPSLEFVYQCQCDLHFRQWMLDSKRIRPI
jgi:hypothetical protein